MIIYHGTLFFQIFKPYKTNEIYRQFSPPDYCFSNEFFYFGKKKVQRIRVLTKYTISSIENK